MALLGLALLLGGSASAQLAPSPAMQDPLMSLMLSQPRIDVDSPVIPSAVFDPPVVTPGQVSTYRLSFNALEESIAWSRQLTASPALPFRPGGHGQILAVAGPYLQPRTCFNFQVQPPELGQVTVPAFTVTVYGKPVSVPVAQLQVVAAPPPPSATPQRLILDVPETNLLVGQSIRASIIYPGTPGLVAQGQGPVQIVGQGFIVDLSTLRGRTELRQLAAGGARVPVLIYELILTPLATGNLSAFAQSFVINRLAGPVVISGPVTINGAVPQYTLLDSEPVVLAVRPLPPEGRLPGFTGAVGLYELLGQPELSTNILRVGEPARLRVRVRGDANCDLARLLPPPPPRVRGWQVLAATDENPLPQIVQAQGYTTFSYVLVPTDASAQTTPEIPFCCFEPNLGLYKDLSIPSLPVHVNPGTAPADLQALLLAEALGSKAAPEPVLEGLAPARGRIAASLVPFQSRSWFPFLQLAPGVAFLGLVGWDRRRRYLEAHPDVVLRRKARRALARERRRLHRALRAGDGPGFASAAVNALRVVCAPHYPAEPRALVGGDVLAVLPEAARAGRPGHVVRRFFDITDAARFADTPADARQVFALQPELEDVLHLLEERL